MQFIYYTILDICLYVVPESWLFFLLLWRIWSFSKNNGKLINDYSLRILCVVVSLFRMFAFNLNSYRLYRPCRRHAFPPRPHGQQHLPQLRHPPVHGDCDGTDVVLWKWCEGDNQRWNLEDPARLMNSTSHLIHRDFERIQIGKHKESDGNRITWMRI
jgi:hypothetical protein